MNKEWWRQERRYQRAKKNAETLLVVVRRLNKKIDRLIHVMEDAIEKQKACAETQMVQEAENE